jgi:hypothetical protein
MKIVRFQVLTAASMMFRVVFWDILPCKMMDVRDDSSLMMEAARTSETSVDNFLRGSTSQKTILNFILAAVRT